VFLSTSRNLKRIEGTGKLSVNNLLSLLYKRLARSPIFSHLAASLQGLSTIRAFDAQEVLQMEFDNIQDCHSSAFYMFMACSRTFAFWLDINCIIYIGLVIFSLLFMETGISFTLIFPKAIFTIVIIETYGGNAGLAITQSISLTGMLQRGIRQWSELENQMTSVERIVEYTEVTSESDDGKKLLPKAWPEEGRVEFFGVSMKYSVDGPHVLKKITLTAAPKEKIGIVGRTGAGKSSLISALFRLAHLEGKILIDNVDTSEISLKDLRSKISVIPQEPILFSGTLRKNLDPFDEYSDSELWSALQEVELKDLLAELPSGLSSRVSEGGSNFSVGEKQLLCLARAILRDNRILILDEATANVDVQTDELIQNTIRRKFQNCTVLIIAHRLHTVMDADKILVLDDGQVTEFNHPHLLLENTEGLFYSLVKQTGNSMALNLMKMAEKVYM
jgi:ATP-binding cassette subfamily C (CFTR/MRP) protein 4